MKQLTLRDVRKLLNAVQSVYTLQNLETFGTDTLSILEQLVSQDASVFVASRVDGSETTIMQSLSQDFERLMKEDLCDTCYRYNDENPLVQNMPLTLLGAHKVSDFVNRKEFFQTEAYQQIMKRIGVDDISGMALYSGDPSKRPRGDEYITAYYFYQQSWESLTERDRLVLNLIQPHLNQAYQTVTRFQSLQKQLTQLQQSLDRSGVIFLDDLGQVKLITSQAARWLEDYFNYTYLFDRLPDQLNSWIRHQISQLKTDSNLPSPCLPLCLELRDRQLTIRLVIDEPGEQYLLLLAEERVISLLASLEAIGLSKQEAKILFWAIQGKDNTAIAQEMNIRYRTVGKHLENIYRKLNAHSRSEAVTVALEKCGCLNSPPLL
ncbi:MAG: helix-turn-helix transcriptional regulator [Cyanosarcina radialis HA8281-LM2]|jgi:DNA-binding CsgD family transcriptional regulator|nr:helix-turn-helix transcriptional regulator [Cyanosarcina radialis HA8281-LM2]